MKNEYKYYEFDPGQSLMFLLNKTIGQERLNAISFFQSPLRNILDVYSSVNGWFTKVNKYSPLELPDREIKEKELIEINKFTMSPKIVQNIFSPQKSIFPHAEHNTYVLILRFLNPKDLLYDYLYILIDKRLLQSVESLLNKLSTSKDEFKGAPELVLRYFKLNYTLYHEFIDIEYKKYQYFDEMTSTLRKTISRTDKMEQEIKDLKEAQKSGLENEIANILRELSDEHGSQLKLSEKARKYVLKYQGDEKVLIQAIVDAAHLVKRLNALNRTKNIEIDLNYIEINIDKDDSIGNIPEEKHKNKALFFLDTYENAATAAKHYKNKVTINLVAEQVKPKSIKPPAISASIRKYEKEMRYLLLTYPQKWMVLRTHFNPIRKLISG